MFILPEAIGILIAHAQGIKVFLASLASYQYKEAKQIMETGSKEDIIKLISDYEKQLDRQRSYRLMIFKMINVYKDPTYRSTRLILLQIPAH